MKKTIKKILILITKLGFPFTIISSIWLKIIRKVGIGKITDFIFMRLGVLPVEDYYYQPMINQKIHLIKSLGEDRNLHGLDLNIEDQLSILSKFNYSEELMEFPLEESGKLEFNYNNSSYESGVLVHKHREKLLSGCPILEKQSGREPGSFWIRKK